jgi:hypothetical protein
MSIARLPELLCKGEHRQAELPMSIWVPDDFWAPAFMTESAGFKQRKAGWAPALG